MSKANPIKPTTKESYAMPKAQSQPSNRFEVLGKIPKSFTPTSSNLIYKSKEARQLIQVLEFWKLIINQLQDLLTFKRFSNKISFFFFLFQMTFQKPVDSMSLYS